MGVNPFDRGFADSDELRALGFAAVGERVFIARDCTIVGLANIAIGDDVRIDGGTTILAAKGSLAIGSYVHIGGGSHLACAGGVTIEDFAGLSQGVRIYSATDDYTGRALTNPTVPKRYLNVTAKPVRLGRHVIVGSGSVVLPGVTVGEGSSVGALSLVTKSFDPWGVWFGSPVRRLKSRRKDLLAMEEELRSSS